MEVDEAANHSRGMVDPDANIIVGSAFNPDLDGKMRVSVVATGIDARAVEEPQPQASRFGGFFATPIGAGLGGTRSWSARSDGRRVGEECDCKWSSRWTRSD